MSRSIPVVVPQTNPNDDHAVLVRWHVASGQHISTGATLATLETTKATFDVPAPSDGFAFYDLGPNALVPVGATIARLTQDGMPPDLEEQPREGAVPAGEAKFTRKALRLMKQMGLSESHFPAAQRVDVAEVERVAREQRGERPTQNEATPNEATQLLEQTPAKVIEARTLAEVYRQAVPSTVSVAVSVEKNAAHLQRLSEKLGPISLLELVIHQCALLLADFPDLNGFHADGRAWRHERIAVGFAINLGRSLRVPVVGAAADMTQIEVARAVRDLSLRYLRDELRLEDLADGTFTISDLSSYGVVHFVPVLNRRQAATLGICAERPGTGHFDLVLTFDHRIADGMRAGQFLGELRARIEDAPRP